MATTTNYGWTTPDDTALVKDGASAIRTLGTAIDTTTFNNAAAAIAKTIVDAKGDIIAATAADTVSRLAVGTNDQVLTADSTAATGLKWAAPAAGGMTLISTTTLTGASITLSSIPSTYNNLQLVIRNYIPATDGRGLYMRFNSDSNTRYFYFATNSANNASSTSTFSDSFMQIASGNDNAVSQSLSVVNIYDYTNTATWKINDVRSIVTNSSTNTSYNMFNGFGGYNQTSAISSITFLTDVGNLTSGTVLLYGVK